MARGNSMWRARAIAGAVDPAVVPGLLVFALFVVFAVRDAGYPATVWYPAALFVVVLLVVCAWAGRLVSFAALPAAALFSAGFLALLSAWTYVSIAWSDVQGDAWDGANRGLLYLAVYVLFLAVPPRRLGAAWLVASYVVAITAVGVAELVEASHSANPDSYFLIARFAEPTGYQNANCALFSISFWPALVLASRGGLPAWLRAVLLACAGMLAELAVLSQSRAWLVAMPLVFVLYVAAVRKRVRAVTFTVPVAAVVVAASAWLLDVFPALHSGREISSALASARDALLVSGLVLLFAGAALLLAEHSLRKRELAARRLRRAGGVLFATVALAALVAGLVWLGNPKARATDAWREFKGTQPSKATASYFASGFGSNRYDLWRVALAEFRDAPAAGIGSDNFAVGYLRERRSDEEPLYPHSIELRILTQTGIVGALLFAGFLVSALVAAFRRVPTGSVSAACFLGFAYWLVHGSVDWFWEIPGLAAPAFAFLALAIAGREAAAPVVAARWSPRRYRLAFAALVLAAAAGVVSLTGPWLAAKQVETAAGEWRTQPEDAFDRLARARRLNPLSDQPDVIAGAIASRLGDTGRMAVFFRRALERNPHNWYARLELAVADARSDRRRDALRELAAAHRLDPREPTIALVASRVRHGRPISTAELDRIYLRRNEVSNRTRR